MKLTSGRPSGLLATFMWPPLGRTRLPRFANFVTLGDQLQPFCRLKGDGPSAVGSGLNALVDTLLFSDSVLCFAGRQAGVGSPRRDWVAVVNSRNRSDAKPQAGLP